jgi:hypothetical protein
MAAASRSTAKNERTDVSFRVGPLDTTPRNLNELFLCNHEAEINTPPV